MKALCKEVERKGLGIRKRKKTYTMLQGVESMAGFDLDRMEQKAGTLGKAVYYFNQQEKEHQQVLSKKILSARVLFPEEKGLLL